MKKRSNFDKTGFIKMVTENAGGTEGGLDEEQTF